MCFNILSTVIRYIMSFQWESLEKDHDKQVQCVPDKPGCGGYIIGLLAAASNSLTEQSSNIAVWSLTEL